MPKTKTKRPRHSSEPDALYFLKLVVYLILGSFWLKFSDGSSVQVPLPVGFLIGLVFASHDHVQFDRKVGYALLLAAMFVGFWAPFGLYVIL